MPVLNCRTRILSFRLSEEEYEAFMAAFRTSGARSLSDYARFTWCKPPDGGKGSTGDPKAQRSIRKLKRRLDELDQLVQRLTLEVNSNRRLNSGPLMNPPGGSDPLASRPSQARSD